MGQNGHESMCVGPMLAGYQSANAGETLWAANRVMIGLPAAGSDGQMNVPITVEVIELFAGTLYPRF